MVVSGQSAFGRESVLADRQLSGVSGRLLSREKSALGPARIIFYDGAGFLSLRIPENVCQAAAALPDFSGHNLWMSCLEINWLMVSLRACLAEDLSPGTRIGPY